MALPIDPNSMTALAIGNEAPDYFIFPPEAVFGTVCLVRRRLASKAGQGPQGHGI